jgi:hypothetical protein
VTRSDGGGPASLATSQNPGGNLIKGLPLFFPVRFVLGFYEFARVAAFPGRIPPRVDVCSPHVDAFTGMRTPVAWRVRGMPSALDLCRPACG